MDIEKTVMSTVSIDLDKWKEENDKDKSDLREILKEQIRERKDQERVYKEKREEEAIQVLRKKRKI